MKELIKLFVREFFFFFGWLCFFGFCLYPVYTFFMEKKVELLSIKSVEIINSSKYASDMLWLLLGTGILTFIIITDKRKKEKKAAEKAATEKQEIVE